MKTYKEQMEQECEYAGGCKWYPVIMVEKDEGWYVRYQCSHCYGTKEEVYKDQPYEIGEVYGPGGNNWEETMNKSNTKNEEIAPGLEIRDQRGSEYEKREAPWAWYLRVGNAKGKCVAEFGEGALTREEAYCAGVAFYHGLWWGQRGVPSPMGEKGYREYSSLPECFPGKPQLNDGIPNSPWLWVDPKFTYEKKE